MPEMMLPIPNEPGWPYRALGDACELIHRGTAPSYVESSDVSAIGQRCVTASGFDPSFARPHDERRMRGALEPRPGDVFLNSTGTGTIGRSCRFSGTGRFMVDGHVTVLRAKDSVADGRWIDALLRSPWGQAHLEARCFSGSTNQVELSRTQLAATAIPTPAVREQRRIAEIFDAVDEAIRSTETLIAKLEQMKQGLLHDLLTRGITGSGALRDSAADLRRFLDPARGLVPAGWTITPLHKLAVIAGGVTLGRNVSGSGTIALPYMRVANVQDGFIDTAEMKLIRVYEDEVPRYRLETGDVLMTEGGDFDKLGRGAVWDGRIDPCLHQNHIFRVRCDRSRLLPSFLAAFSSSVMGKGYFRQSSKQTTNLASINMKQLRAYPVATPPIAEQKRIVEVLGQHGICILGEITSLSKLRLLKVGLMEDLLTGRVRVKVNDQDAT
jgi:type I restriction enzyme S subunit